MKRVEHQVPGEGAPHAGDPLGECGHAAALVEQEVELAVAVALLAVVVVLVAIQVVGRLVTRLGRPRVMGEVATGIPLGPGVLRIVAPRCSAVERMAADRGRSRSDGPAHIQTEPDHICDELAQVAADGAEDIVRAVKAPAQPFSPTRSGAADPAERGKMVGISTS